MTRRKRIGKTTNRRNPSDYKTRWGLYCAVVRVLDRENQPMSVRDAWWLQGAYQHCEQTFPDLLPQLNELRSGKIYLEDLIPIN